jgi:PAS domain S-box-containing protein
VNLTTIINNLINYRQKVLNIIDMKETKSKQKKLKTTIKTSSQLINKKGISKKEAIRGIKATLQAVIESLPFDFFLINEDGRYAMQNAICRKHWGDLIGKRPKDVSTDKSTLKLWQDNNRRAFAGEVVEEEVDFPRQGEPRYYYNIISPIRENDHIRGILGINIDITKRKQIEEELYKHEKDLLKVKNRLNFILDTSPIVLYTSKASGDYGGTYVSGNIESLLGYKPTDFTSNPTFWVDNIHPDDREKVLKDLSQLYKEGSYIHEYRFRQADDTYRWMHDELKYIYDKEGNPLEVIGCWIDITERKEAEKEIQDKTQNLEELNTALRVLLKKREEDKTQSEDKIMMNIRELVKPYLDKLKKGEQDKTLKTYIDIIESNLDEIVSSFTVKLSSGHLNLTPTEIQVANLIKQGKRSKEIAELMHSSPKAVAFHRGNIRKKLGLQNKKTNLRSYLLSCFNTSD